MVIVIIFFILLAGFFSLMETAFITSNPINIQAKYYNKNKIIKKMYSNLNFLINTTLVGINFSIVACSIITTNYLTNWYSFNESVLISGFSLTFVFLIFSEVIPKTFAIKNPEFFIKIFYPILYVFNRIFYPILFLLNILSFFKKSNHTDYLSRREVEYILSGNKEDENKEIEREHLIQNVLELSKFRIKDVMIPINKVFSVSIDESLDRVKQKFIDNYFNKIPVYENYPNNIVGYITSKDVIFSGLNKVSDILKKTLLFPETKTLDKTLFELQESCKTLGIVIDEHGAISGVVIKNDILKKIVGGIEDENNNEEDIEIKEKNYIILSGNKEISYLNKKYGLGIEGNEFNTLAGFISYYLNRLPIKGDEFVYKGHLFRVIETKNYIANKVFISKEFKQ
ncbi:MAG TPA: hemolysin family protein [Spirochaetota bacterium]|nr:hemolysin family protein [Spirochaetota bacterium]HOM38246.1 hemolysin family protein [Spirochaetota bacterium]HPQ48536.1 hemolysin family protein [Spirochaetota bacterium]